MSSETPTPTPTPVPVTVVKESTPSIADKTTMANVVAAVAVIGGVAAGIYALVKGDMTLIENLAFAGAGFLFGATVAKTKE